MTRLRAKPVHGTRMVVVIALGSLAYATQLAHAQTATGWTLGDPLVTYWSGPSLTNAIAEQAVDAGFNRVTVMGNPGPEYLTNQLDIAEAYGLRGQFYSDVYLTPDSLDGGSRQAALDVMIDTFKAHPAAYSYYIPGLGDEPHLDEFNDLLALKHYINQRDPDHLVFINLPSGNPSSPSYGAPAMKNTCSNMSARSSRS